MSKQYGLILAGQQQKKPTVPAARREVTKPSIFDESSSDSSDAGNTGPGGRPPQLKPKAPHQMAMMERRMARAQQEKALEEDPTVYQYDELYDEMENKREEEKQVKINEPKKPKYIGRLMECAERRKLENELRVERQVQKEREEEGEQFKDKESFVTSAYRKKLEEMRKMEEQDKRDEYLEAIGDVTKQKDLDGFYRHLYEQKLGTSKAPPEKPDLPNSDASDEEIAYKPIKSGRTQQQRAYRKRRSSEDEPEEQRDEEKATEAIAAKKVHLQNNIDADSDFSIDSSSSSDEEEEEKTAEKSEKAAVGHKSKKSKNATAVEQPAKLPQTDPATIALKLDVMKKEKDAEEAVPADKESKATMPPPPAPAAEQPPKPKKDKREVWKKRTVGPAFDAAVQRYYERKAARSA